MKWFWRIHKVNGSFDFALKEIGGCTLKYLDIDFELTQFAYLFFNGETNGYWNCTLENDDAVFLDLIERWYKFKGNVGVK
jgi:hypothetical protein